MASRVKVPVEYTSVNTSLRSARGRLLGSLLGLPLFAAIAGARAIGGERYAERLATAFRALDADELDSAHAEFARCLELRPRNANCAYTLACVAARRAQTRASLDWLAKAVEWGYDDADVAEWDTVFATLRGETSFRVAVAAMRSAAALRPDTGTRVLLQPVLERIPSRSVHEPCASGDGAVVVGAFELESTAGRHSIAAFDTRTGATLADFDLPESTASLQLARDQGGDVRVFTLEGATLRARDALTGQVVGEWAFGELVATADDARYAFDVAPGARAALFEGSDRRRALVELESRKVLARFEGSRHPGRATKWSDDGALLALDDEPAAVRVYRASTGAPIGASIRTSELPDVVEAIGLSNDGALVALTGGNRVYVFDASTGARAHVFEIQSTSDGQRSFWVQFQPGGKDLVATLSASGTIACWDLESGLLRWQTEELGGNWSRLRASYDTSGTRVFVSGMLYGHVLTANEGAVATDLFTWGLASLDPLSKHGGAIALDKHGLAVLQGEQFESVSRFYPAGLHDWLVVTDADYCTGNGAALEVTQVTVPGHTLPLSCYAAICFDPKRVRAALSGVPVRPNRFPAPPVLALVGDATRRVAADAERVEFEVDVQDARGFLGCEAELDGSNLDAELSPLFTELGATPIVRRLRMSLALPPARGEFELRLSAVGVSGVSSRPVRVRIERAH
ncbi:MAG: WD40 repeat domain-containing protein [Planctomycetes bacterium]|nr:WD40 repeat domain-containing protein [Planctomycetota bacterium]